MSATHSVPQNKAMVKEAMRIPTQDDSVPRLKRTRARGPDGSDHTDSSSNHTGAAGTVAGAGEPNRRTIKAAGTGPIGAPQPNNEVENTYQLEPESWKFREPEVEELAEKTLIKHLANVKYDPQRCKQLSQELASRIMDSIKALQIKRYKLIAVVSIGSIKERPGMQFGSRCLWNQDTDSFISVKFTNGSLFAVAMVYGLYFE